MNNTSLHGSTSRQLSAGRLAVEFRETIARWFALRNEAQNSELILKALADLAAEQIIANSTEPAQIAVLNRFLDEVILARRDANRRRMGGMPVDLIVKQ